MYKGHLYSIDFCYVWWDFAGGRGWSWYTQLWYSYSIPKGSYICTCNCHWVLYILVDSLDNRYFLLCQLQSWVSCTGIYNYYVVVYLYCMCWLIPDTYCADSLVPRAFQFIWRYAKKKSFARWSHITIRYAIDKVLKLYNGLSTPWHHSRDFASQALSRSLRVLQATGSWELGLCTRHTHVHVCMKVLW